MDRRKLVKAGLQAGLQAGLAFPLAYVSRALAQSSTFLGDMHAHFFFNERGTSKSGPVARILAEGNVTLAAWSLVGDALWMDATPRGFVQKSVPKAGDTLGWFQRELARMKRHIAEQKLNIIRTPSDVELALTGVPHVVLAVEGASFVEDDPGRLKMAYDLGIRHLQLVHYVRNTLGDFQTVRPEHGGLTDLGKNVIQECNRLGILVDLAHSTSAAVTQALAISKLPMVWSHSSVTARRKPDWRMIAWQARQLSLEDAKAITRKGGVVGLWALRQDVGGTIESYANRLSEMADWLGEDHVAFGTDMNGLGANAVISTYADLRRVAEYWQRRQVSRARIQKLAIGNYARVLQTALASREA
jgi:membrane dipeptidase